MMTSPTSIRWLLSNNYGDIADQVVVEPLLAHLIQRKVSRQIMREVKMGVNRRENETEGIEISQFVQLQGF